MKPYVSLAVSLTAAAIFGAIPDSCCAQVPDTRTAPDAQRSARPSKDSTCLVVPLHGEFGEETSAPGIRAALRYAKQHQIQHVLLDFDSPGGNLYDGRAVAEQIRANRDSITIHAIVREAFSAAMWALVECDQIWVDPRGRSGAAVAFKVTSKGSGAVEVDKKLNAALAAQLAAAAEGRGRPGALFRAMVEMEAEVWMTTDSEGRKSFFDYEPVGGVKATKIDGRDTVVALTARQMVDFGIAQPLPVSPSAPDKKRWSDLMAFGNLQDGTRTMADQAAVVEKAAAATVQAQQRWRDANQIVLDQSKWIVEECNRAEEEDPRKMTVWYRDTSGVLTAESQIKWRETCDAVIGRWSGIERGASDLERAVSAAKKAAAAYENAIEAERRVRLWEPSGKEDVSAEVVGHNVDLNTVRQDARENLKWLRANRVRFRIDQ